MTAEWTIEPVCWPCTVPVTVGGEKLIERRGWRVTRTDAAGRLGRGECCPLPGRQAVDLQAARAQLQAVLSGRLAPEAAAPVVRNAVDQACDTGPAETRPVSVCLNGLLTTPETPVETLWRQGYRCVKVKVGRRPLAEDIERVQALQRSLPADCRLRLDANRAWSLTEALAFGRAVGPAGIQYIEEPTRQGRDHERFVAETGLPVAWDETVEERSGPGPVSGFEPAAVVLKPAVLGGRAATRRWVDWARSRGRLAVLSSCFEGPWALRSYARWAHRWGLAQEPQGLDTWRWLEAPWSAAGLSMREGRLWVD